MNNAQRANRAQKGKVIVLADTRCSYCGSGPLDQNQTCPDCHTTMPTNWTEFWHPRHVYEGISSREALFASEAKYHGPGRRLTEGTD